MHHLNLSQNKISYIFCVCFAMLLNNRYGATKTLKHGVFGPLLHLPFIICHWMVLSTMTMVPWWFAASMAEIPPFSFLFFSFLKNPFKGYFRLKTYLGQLHRSNNINVFCQKPYYDDFSQIYLNVWNAMKLQTNSFQIPRDILLI